MTRLSLHGEPVETVFHLLGKDENAMTKSLGWCLSQVPSFLDRLGDVLGTPDLSARAAAVRLQESQTGTGITDLEIYAPGYAAWIIEAKRGFAVPSIEQLEKYAARLAQLKDRDAKRGLTVLAGLSTEWLVRQLPGEINRIPVRAISWRDVRQMAERTRGGAGRAGSRLLVQFQTYLESRHTFGGTTRFIDVVEKHRQYFHPVGGSYPAEPPNYIAFRYDKLLQSIHHVDGYEIITDLGGLFPASRARREHAICMISVRRSALPNPRLREAGSVGPESGAISMPCSRPTRSPRPWKLRNAENATRTRLRTLVVW